jgi:hypothetical protein
MLHRAVAAGILAAPILVGCSLFVSLDGLSDRDGGVPDGAITDAAPNDSASDAGPSADATSDAESPYFVVDPCVADPTDVADLTTLGALDWSHFASPAGELDTKNTSTHILGLLTQSDAGNHDYADDQRTFSWTDGTIQPNEPGTHSGVFDDVGPMTLTATAGSSPRVLTVYIDTFTANAKLDVSLSTGLVATPQIFVGGPDVTQALRCAIHYSAPTAATVTVTLSLTETIAAGGDIANIAFAAATVAPE